MIHNLNSAWKDLAKSLGVDVNNDTNTNVIMDDIFNWASSFNMALQYMEYQLRICKAYHLTLSLKKSQFFLKQFKFVGIDVLPDGNRPAMSKHQLLEHWPKPEYIHDVASFVGFLQFYSAFIPFFEVRATLLREIMKHEYTSQVGDLWNSITAAAFEELQKCLLNDPCLRRFDHKKLTILQTDFSSLVFGFIVRQPDNNDASLALITQYMSGNGFDFMTTNSNGTLHPIAFGLQRTQGNKRHLHSYLGKLFAGDWAMGKCCHMLFGCCFIWVTDCYAARFLLSYNGSNQAIQHLQMHIMGWDVDIVHRTNNYLVYANYWSHLNEDLCYDPTFKDYIRLVATLQSQSSSPSDLPILPENMPYYCGPQIKHPVEPCADDIDHQNTLAATAVNFKNVDSIISIQPVQFGTFADPAPVMLDERHNYNNEFLAFALSVARVNWEVYSFNSGNFASSISTRNLPFHVILACNPFAYGRALFEEFTKCPCILSSANALLDHIRGSDDQSPINCYMIHSHWFQSSKPTTTFWLLQTSIITQLHIIRLLTLFVAYVHPDHDGRSVSRFVSDLSKTGWVISSTKLEFSSFGDSIVGTTTMIVEVHNSTESTVDKFHLRIPPSTPPQRLQSLLWNSFNKAEFGVLFG